MNLMTRLVGFVFVTAMALTGCGGAKKGACSSTDPCNTGESCCLVECPGGVEVRACFVGACPMVTCDGGIIDVFPVDMAQKD